MSLDFGNLLGAVTQLKTNSGKKKSLKNFLKTIDKFGVQVTNNFEVNFSALDDITFFVQSINIPSQEITVSEISYNGRKIEVPVFYDQMREINVTVINDGNGYIFSSLTNICMTDINSDKVDTGNIITIKALTGDKNYKGTLYKFFGVRLTSVDSLEYNYEGGDKSTFNITFKCNYFTVTTGSLGKTSNIIGAINSLIS